MLRIITSLLLLIIAVSPAGAQFTTDLFRDLELRSLGPSLTTGRISDIAVDPRDRSVWYVAAASGGLWRTTNHGTTFEPIFDQYGSYSMGCITIGQSRSTTDGTSSAEQKNALGNWCFAIRTLSGSPPAKMIGID